MIKVADFGLSENMDTSKEYFRQTEDSITKLPLRWLALHGEHKFSEKTDVVWKGDDSVQSCCVIIIIIMSLSSS